MDIKLKVKKYKDTGDIAWEYNPLRNLKNLMIRLMILQ